MPEVVFCILMALCEYDEATEFEISAASGYAPNGGQSGGHWRILTRLVQAGWVHKPWAGIWMITERGKIALAIEVGRRSKRRYENRPVTRRGLRKEFLEIA